MKQWDHLLADPRHSGVYDLPPAAGPEFRRAAANSGLELFPLDLAGIDDKAAFLRAAADLLRFPPYFGSNWDAFEECLTDLSWLETEGWLLLIEHPDSFRENAPEELATARDILDSAAAFWKEQGVCFFVGIVSAPQDKKDGEDKANPKEDRD
jgi:hypothetical protein